MNQAFARALAPCALTLTLATVSRAAPRDLSEEQPASFYVAHGVVAASAIASTSLLYSFAEASSPRTGSWLSFEDPVERHFSPSAMSLSDGLLVTSMLVPIAAQSGASGTEFGNSVLVYGESLAVSLWLNTAVKYVVRRARPYTHHPSEEVRKFAEARGDQNLSFYSGHASTAFTALVSGALVFSSTHEDDDEERYAFWGVQSALAAATAHLRVRAGKHYYTDVLVGALVGAGVGLLVPYAAGVRYRLDAGDWAALGGGLVVGGGLALVVPSDELGLLRPERSSAWAPRLDAIRVSQSPSGAGWIVALGGTL